MKRLEREVITLNLKKIGVMQKRTVRGNVLSVDSGKIIFVTDEKLLLGVRFKSSRVNQRVSRICYYYLKDESYPLPFKDSQYTLDWEKLKLDGDLIIEGRKMEIYVALY